MRRLHFDTVLMVVMAICALTVTALIVRREFFVSATKEAPENSTVSGWRSLREAGNSLGPRDAKVAMIIFEDFQCPFCRKYSSVVDSIRRTQPDVQIVERNFPLTNIHPQAFKAALAAECAASVGKYWEMRSAMFKNAELVESEAWGELAKRALIADTLALVKCVSSERMRSRIVADEDAARRVDAGGTPTVIINDVKFGVPPTVEEIAATVSAISGHH